MKILAIETSCDETAASVIEIKKDKTPGLLSNFIYSQIKEHSATLGVVPEVASRAHVAKIIPVVENAIEEAKVNMTDIDYLAVTAFPGLMGSLLVGVNTAKTLSLLSGKPIISINHLEGHIYSNFITKDDISFPAIFLIVSGGHTSLVLMKGHGKYITLGQTIDDAAGEAFDKVAKILDLGYPGGPAVAKVASEYKTGRNKNTRVFPCPMIDSGDFNFSFSGIKTAVLYDWQKEDKKNIHTKREIAYAFQEAVVDVLVSKTIRAAHKYKAKTISICGGVAANKRLRECLGSLIERELPGVSYVIPEIRFCGDNAAMIGMAAAYHLIRQNSKKNKDLSFPVLSNKDL